MNNIIGIDIGGTNFRIGISDGKGNILRFMKLPVKDVLKTSDVLEDIALFIESFAGGESVSAVAIGFPATLNRERTKILQAPNLKFMENLPVTEYLTDRLNIPVYAERDVTMTLYYDVKKYRLPTSGIICGIYFGTGIGNAILIDGVPLLGKNGTAGELGHIPVDGSGEVCGCGLVGCIETLAGGKYLAGKYPADEMPRLFAEHAGELREFIGRMAMAAASEINILDPDYVIIGGGVVNMNDFPVKMLHENIIAHVRRPYPAEGLNIIYAEDEPDKSVAGAAYYAAERMLCDTI